MIILGTWLFVALAIFLFDLIICWTNSDMQDYELRQAIGFSLSWPLILLALLIAVVIGLVGK